MGITTDDIKHHVNLSILSVEKSRVYFKAFDRQPVYGKFVALRDHEELKLKGMVRFVNEKYMDEYEQTEHTMYTRLYRYDSISLIKNF